MRNMMKPETIRSAIQLANKTNHILVATTSSEGTPHVAAAGGLNLDSEDHISVAAWFCPGTLANLKNNKQISVVVWDASEDFGYQLLGSVEHIEELAMLNGFAPEIEAPFPLPQVEHSLHMRVNRVLHFSQAPHSDLEEE
jgi:hypothetical protein